MFSKIEVGSLVLRKGDKIAEDRRVLKNIKSYWTVDELFNKILEAEPWPYRPQNMDRLFIRDKALCSLQYLLAARISEVLRLRKGQFVEDEELEGIRVKGIKLSKRKSEEYRPENTVLPLYGPRKKFTLLVLEHLHSLKVDERLFQFGTNRAWQIVNHMLGIPDHWLRAFGEDYLYDRFDGDLLAVADYVRVDARTLQLYLRKRYEKYVKQKRL